MSLFAKIHPESYAHWIVLLPFLSFVYITLKLVVNKNVTVRSKNKEPKPVVTDPTKIPPLWKSFLPILYVVLVAILILELKFGGFASLSKFINSKLNSGFWLINLGFWVVYIGTIFFVPFNSRRWIQKFGPYISVGAIGIAGIIATLLWLKTVTLGLYPGPTADGAWRQIFQTTWFSYGDWKMDIGLKLDGFGIFGAWMVTVVATCIQWFSLGYMWDDDYGRKHIGRYFAEHSLFVTGMLLVVLSNNILTFLIGWEVMGLCSYLLIGFFTYKPSANFAQVKAFIVTRIGDVGFMLGIFTLGVMYHYTQNPLSFDFEQIRHVVTGYDYGAVKLGWLPTAAALLIFMGAVGKSAQFPLHVWLPDAMEGPTPVSALIHAATMVAAGVFLVARFYWLFEMSQTAMMTVAWIGAITAFGAATIGLVQYDIKRILAYSTISQLGYMMIGLGVGSVTAGVFHLLTHAYFKALLFLGSGAVIYGCRHIQDIRYMGGLAKKMPITYWTFLAGTLALAGVFPFAGFWSKDEILASAFSLARNGYSRMVGEDVVQVIHPNNAILIIWFLGLAGAFLTAFYMFRLISYVFLGPNRNYEFRGKQSPDYAHHPSGESDTAAYAAFPVPDGPFRNEEHGEDDHIHPAEPREVPKSMWIPLVILAAFSLLYGFLGMPFLGEKNLVAKFLNHGHAHFPLPDPQTLGLMLVSLVVALAGWHFGLKINNTEAGIRIKRNWKLNWPGLYRTIYNKYFIDEFYEEYIVQPVFMLCQAVKAFDTYVIDGIVNAAGWITYMLAQFQGWWDNTVIDGIVNGVAWLVGYFSEFSKPIQSGYVQNYMMVIIIFVLFYLITMFVK